MKNIWKELPRPIFALAPMEAVTDTVFRRVISSCARPSVYFTEFTNVDGLFSKGAARVEQRLIFTPEEKPLIAQLWGMNLENYEKAAALVADMGYDGIDINMGCPERKVVKRGACAGLIDNPEFAGQIIDAVKRGAPNLAISVKTRIGIKEIETERWISFLLKKNISALTVHLRTAREMSKVPPHWDEMRKVINLRNEIAPDTLILGNGDITNKSDALSKIKKYKMDGVMIGRGIFSDPWLFHKTKRLAAASLDERLDLLLAHSRLFSEEWGSSKNFDILKKFFKIYTLGLDNAGEMRQELMKAKNLEDVESIVEELRIKYI